MLKRGFTIWFTGLSGSGKTTLSNLVHRRLKELGITNVEVLDGDVVTHLSRGLGFTREDMDTKVRRIGWVAELLTRHGVPNLVAAVSPHREARDEVRKMIEHAGGGKGSFVEVFVDCPSEISAARGGTKQPVDGPYEPPHNPELRLRTDRLTPEEGAALVLEALKEKGLIGE